MYLCVYMYMSGGLFVHWNGRAIEREGERESIPSAVSLPKCLHHLGVGQVEARSPEFVQISHMGSRSPGT